MPRRTLMLGAVAVALAIVWVEFSALSPWCHVSRNWLNRRFDMARDKISRMLWSPPGKPRQWREVHLSHGVLLLPDCPEFTATSTPWGFLRGEDHIVGIDERAPDTSVQLHVREVTPDGVVKILARVTADGITPRREGAVLVWGKKPRWRFVLSESVLLSAYLDLPNYLSETQSAEALRWFDAIVERNIRFLASLSSAHPPNLQSTLPERLHEPNTHPPRGGMPSIHAGAVRRVSG